MKIDNHLINTARQFRESFNFEIIWSCWKSFFAESVSFGFDKDETELIKLCDYLFCHKDESIDVCLNCEADGSAILKCADKEVALRYLQSAELMNWLRAHMISGNELSPVAAAQFLLSDLARKAVPDEGPDMKESISSRNEIRLENMDTPYLYRSYAFKGNCLPVEIRTVMFCNVSSSALGYATIQISGENGAVLKSIRLFRNEVVFANFIKDEVIEIFPSLSLACDHVTYLKYLSTGETTMERQMNISKVIHQYEPDKVKNISQFSADDEGGFVGISDRKMIVFSKIFQKDAFDFALSEDEYPVKVAVCGGSYIILSNKGNTYSNCNLNRENIVSVYMTEDQIAVAVTSDGRIVSNRKIKELPADPVKPVELFICNNDRYAFKCYDGKILTSFACTPELTDMNKFSFLKNRLVYLNCEGGLYYKNVEKDEKIAEDVKFFDVKAESLAYYGNNKCVIYE